MKVSSFILSRIQPKMLVGNFISFDVWAGSVILIILNSFFGLTIIWWVGMHETPRFPLWQLAPIFCKSKMTTCEMVDTRKIAIMEEKRKWRCKSQLVTAHYSSAPAPPIFDYRVQRGIELTLLLSNRLITTFMHTLLLNPIPQ